ncbi:hypothetical protein CMI37_10830 [Candidatus Pacearchaeota archaeon]|nr:hypothetical protein [Candidatus Pacearchaeota archaeon]|tara:strand:- start:1618 stop:2118 length:501 start_codon:yes stop_codon:yes gene_type:complete
MENKHIFKIDMVLIAVTVIGLIILVGYSRPLIIAPVDEFETVETNVLFEIEKADRILIDDNLDFTTPDEYVVKEGLEINLKPGDYYWKAVGVWGSEVRQLTINSEVELKLKKLGGVAAGRFGVVNAGSVNLKVDVYNGTELVGNVKVGVGEEIEAEGSKFVGGQDG